MNFNSSVLIKKDKAELIRHYMDDEPTCEKEAFVDDYIAYTAVFPNGFAMDLICCGVGYYDPEDNVNTAWGEAILVNYGGEEVANEVVEGSDEFFSPTTLSGGDGNTYTVHPIICK